MTASAAPAEGSAGGLTAAQKRSAVAVGIAALAVAGIGIYLSFEHVAAFAFEALRFQTLGKARLFTVGVDIGIMVLIALDLLMSWIGRPVRWLRYPAWLLTGATIVLNAASAAPEAGPWRGVDYVAVGAHGVIPFLFIVLVEVVRTSIDKEVRGEKPGDGIPVYRWFLSYGPTFRLWRCMKLWGISSYSEVLARYQDIEVYKAVLVKEHGSLDKATQEELLPLVLVDYGLTLDEAVQAPAKALEQARTIKAAKEADKAAEAARQADQATEDRIRKLERDTALRAAEAQHMAATGQAEVEAGATLEAARRAAEAETEAITSAEAAEAEERRAQAAARAADARRREADASQAAADAEAAAADARRREADAAAATARSEADAAAARRAAAEDAARAADADRRAADARREAARIELAAVEAEDAANLTKKERAVRKVARLIHAAGGVKDAVPVVEVEVLCGVSQATASVYRDEAAQLIADGYRP